LEAELAGRAAADASLELVTALATHALAGGARHAAGYALEAARRSLALFALADATRFAEAGLPLVRQAGDRHAELAFMQLLGEIRRFAGQPEAALSLLESSLTLAQELGETALQGPLLATLGKACLVLSRYEEAQAYCRRAADACLAAGDPSGAARALLADARGSFFRGQVDVAKATCTRALELAQQGQAGSVLAQVLAYAGYLYVASEPEKLADGVGYLERAVALLEPLGDRPGLNDAYVLLGNAQLALGDFKEARASFERCRAIARECGLAEEEAFALVNLAIADLELGAFGRAREAAAEARARSAELGIQLPLGMAIALEASAAARLGRLAAADALFAEALGVAARIGNKYLEATILPYQVEVLAFLGRGPEALAAAARLRALIQETGNTEPEGKLDALEASLLVGAGRPDDARAALARALAAAIATKAKGLHALARLADARRAYAAGAWTEARTTAEAALADVRALGYRYLEGELLALAGHASLAGGLGGPKALFEALAAVAEETGCGLHAALASFGLAAAEPYGPEATARAARAKALLEAFGAELAAEQRAAFLAEPERKRVLEGNFIAASLPAPRQKSNTGPLGLHMRGSGPL
jgi:tetratricopeptide (TPR) repeat protein